MLASFSVIPIGVGEELKRYVSEIVKLVDDSGLDYKLGAMQTTIEGESEEVISLIMRCHERMKEMSSRVLTSITIDDRTGVQGRLEGKVQDVIATGGTAFDHE
jgi:uncharacterized protein (TIGR00106 family)